MALAVLGAMVFVWLSLERHAGFQSHAFDLGNMDQAVWNTLHGRLLRFTDMQVGRNVFTTRLAIHVEPLLVPISLLYLIHSGPETLLVLQAVVVAAGALPAYLLARDVLGSRRWALVFPVAYLLHPSLQNAVLDDFHAVTLSACFLMWAVLYAWRDRVVPFLVWGLLAALTKEEVALGVAGLALVFVARRRRALGFSVALTCLAWFLVCFLVIIPLNNPSGHSPYLARYGYLGHGFFGIFAGVVRHPHATLSLLLSVPRQTYLVALEHPLGFVAMAGLPILLAGLPAMLINALSADPSMYSGFYQYSAEVVPISVGAAAIGIRWAAHGMDRLGGFQSRQVIPVLCSLVFVSSAVDSVRYGFTPLSYGYLVPSSGLHQAIEKRLLARIPADATVAAADEMEPHVAERRWAYLLPTTHPANGPAARWIALDASIPSRPTTPLELHRDAMNAMRHGYGVEAASDGVLILKRGAPHRRIPSGFFTFLYGAGSHVTPMHVNFGPLQLVGATVHPRNGFINRSRPAIAVDSYWRVVGRVSASVHIVFALGPVYTGRGLRLRRTQAATLSTDSPGWDWLPLDRWPRGRTIHVASLALVPPPYSRGLVTVAVEVVNGDIRTHQGLRSARGVRLATISVDW